MSQDLISRSLAVVLVPDAAKKTSLSIIMAVVIDYAQPTERLSFSDLRAALRAAGYPVQHSAGGTTCALGAGLAEGYSRTLLEQKLRRARRR